MLFVAVCAVLFTTSLTAFAARNEGSMEVTARIETAPAETTQPSADSDSTVLPDNGNISTGEAISACVVISLLLLAASLLVIYFFNKNDKCNSIHSSE